MSEKFDWSTQADYKELAGLEGSQWALEKDIGSPAAIILIRHS